MQFADEFNLADYFLFDRVREGHGEKVAIRFGERTWTYAQVAENTRALARYFHSIGVAREQRVYTVLPDVPPFAWSFFATLAHGAVVAMGNPASPPDDLSYVVDYSRCSVLITTPPVAEALLPVLATNRYLSAVVLVPECETGGDCDAHADATSVGRQVPFDVISMSDALERGRGADDVAMPPVRRDDVAVWLFTSGSTGRPKAAVHTHRDFAFNTEAYAKGTVGYRSDDVTVSVPRLFFGYATGTNLMFPFAVGATTCLFSERPTAESLARAIEMYRPTVVTNVPTMMSKLLDYDDARRARGKDGLDLSSVRFHLSAGEALPPALLERFIDRFGNDVYDGIGSAEMFHIYASNRPGDIKPGSLGRVVEGYTIRILESEATEPGSPELAPGDTGVMWVRGDSVALGYFQDREKSWETFHGHWCRTGDLFHLDGDGYLWFSGRADSLFKCGGVWVAPLEIEECLGTHESVAMAAVIPSEDDGLQKPKAYIVLREGVHLKDESERDALTMQLQKHVKGRLSKHKYPRWIVFLDDLPRNDRGKVDRKTLIEADARGQYT